MSLRINNNIAAINAHRNLLNTTMGLTKSMEKLSSGYRINRASDNPAGLVISEQFRAQIGGLNQAIGNSEGSINMIQTAEGALTELNALMISMRELAIHAANEGFNDITQLEADQAEIDNAVRTIDRIAANTQFGTKKLIDGSNANVAAFTTDGSSGISIRESYLTQGEHYISAIKTTESSATLNTTANGVTLDEAVSPYGQPANLTDGVHNLDVLQASAAADKDNGSSVVIQDNWSNGITFAVGATIATVMGTGDLSGGFVSADNGTYTLHVAWQDGANITATVDLSFTVDLHDATTYSVQDARDALNSAITGTALDGGIAATVIGNELGFETVTAGAVHSLGVEAFVAANDYAAGTFGDGAGGFSAAAVEANMTWAAADDRGVADQNLRLEVISNDSYADALNQTVTIQFDVATEVTTLAGMIATLNGALDDAIGVGFGMADATVQNVTAVLGGADSDRVDFITADEGSDYSIRGLAAAITGDESAAAALGMTIDTVAITGVDAIISLDGYTNALNRVDWGVDRNYTLIDAADGTDGQGSVMVVVDGLNSSAAGGGVAVSNMLLSVNAARFNVSLDGGPAASIIAGNDTIVYDGTREESIKIVVGLDAEGGAETISNTDQSLVFQIGANVGQTAKIALRNMAASQLGRNIAGNMFVSLAEINVTTVQGAQDSQLLIDAAINEISTTRGTLGSFQKNTLESNLRNLRIASQNLQSSESNIRDTDMAYEMSNFVKNQILMQAGTAMLAQANQIPQVVLSLFG
jgi:flagellin